MDFDALWARFVTEHPEASPLRIDDAIAMRGLVGFLAWAVDRAVIPAQDALAFLQFAEGWGCYQEEELRWAQNNLHALLEDMHLVERQRLQEA